MRSARLRAGRFLAPNGSNLIGDHWSMSDRVPHLIVCGLSLIDCFSLWLCAMHLAWSIYSYCLSSATTFKANIWKLKNGNTSHNICTENKCLTIKKKKFGVLNVKQKQYWKKQHCQETFKLSSNKTNQSEISSHRWLFLQVHRTLHSLQRAAAAHAEAHECSWTGWVGLLQHVCRNVPPLQRTGEKVTHQTCGHHHCKTVCADANVASSQPVRERLTVMKWLLPVAKRCRERRGSPDMEEKKKHRYV